MRARRIISFLILLATASLLTACQEPRKNQDAHKKEKAEVQQSRSHQIQDDPPHPETPKESLMREMIRGHYFDPAQYPELLGLINGRTPMPATCARRVRVEPANWPGISPKEPLKALARRVQRNGASDSTWAVLELDPETVEAALQIAVATDTIDLSELTKLRAAAAGALFKLGAKTFILMHNSNARWFLGPDEPYLISERSGKGRLVGLSASFASGLLRKQIGMLMFDDRVCEQDLTYVLGVPSMHTNSDAPRPVSISSLDDNWSDRRFTFGSNDNIANIIAAAYTAYLPQYQRLQNTGIDLPDSSVRSSSAGFSWTKEDVVGMIGLAINIVQLILALAK